MTALKPITAAALVAMLALPVHADVSGLACVTDGDTLVVNGKHQRNRCVGGIKRHGDDALTLGVQILAVAVAAFGIAKLTK